MLGIDIVDISKFETKIKKENFINNIFTKNEILYAQNKKNSTKTYAGMFAAKEAIVKACNLNLYYILRKKIEIKHDKKNKPYALIDNKKIVEISISHDSNYAVAICKFNDDYLYCNEKIKKFLKKRDKNSHKGDFGRVAIIGGSRGMAGSVYLSSQASLKSGCGLSHIICPSSISNILQIKATESIIEEVICDDFYYSEEIYKEILNKISNKDSLAIGPGLGKNSNLDILIEKILKSYDKNVVIDADGLNAISSNVDVLKYNKNIVITPHLMEFHRLTKIDIDYIKNNKVEVAKDFAKKYKVIVVLKGHNTIVTDGSYTYINETGNCGMATAGSGDVLTGIILSNLAIMNPLSAAILSVYIHGLAGDFAKKTFGEDSMIASDIVNNIYKSYKLLRS